MEQTKPNAPAQRSWLNMLWRIVPPALALLLIAGLWLASSIAVPPELASWTGRLQSFVTVFLGTFIEALPFLLIGVLTSSAIHLFISDAQVQQMSPRNPVLAALSGAFLGLAFPVCECGSIPTARRLLSKGVALPAGIAFVLAAPVINPVVLVATYVAFSSWEMVAWRAGLTVLFAVIIGLLLGTPKRPEDVLLPDVCAPDAGHHHHDEHHHHDHEHNHDLSGLSAWGKLREVLIHANSEFFEMGRYLITGCMLAAGFQTFISQEALLALGGGPVLSVLVMIALAFVLSICSTVDAFVALSFVNTFTRGSILAFLVFGPMIDIKSILMLTTTFRRRTVALMILLCFQLTLLASITINMYLL